MTADGTGLVIPTKVRLISAAEVERLLPALVELLRESVNGGASLGFLPPLAPEECRSYWLSLRAELRAGSRLLFGIYLSDRLIGSGQLVLTAWPNARHRAEVHKVFVTTALKGRGIGRTLVGAMHDAARERGRSLLLLNTRRGDPAEAFYKGLGYREVGVTPGYTVGPAGEAHDNLTLYRAAPPDERGRR